MKRFYVEEDDNGKEIKRKLTTFANDDLTQLSDDELETIYYESSESCVKSSLSKVVSFRLISLPSSFSSM